MKKGPEEVRKIIDQRKREIYQSLEDIKSKVESYSQELPTSIGKWASQSQSTDFRDNIRYARKKLGELRSEVEYLERRARVLSAELSLLNYLEGSINSKNFENLIKELYNDFSNLGSLIRREGRYLGRATPHIIAYALIPEIISSVEFVRAIPIIGNEGSKALETYLNNMDKKAVETFYALRKAKDEIYLSEEVLRGIEKDPSIFHTLSRKEYSNYYALLLISFILGASITSLINASKGVTGMVSVGGQLFVINVVLIFVTLILFFFIMRKKQI